MEIGGEHGLTIVISECTPAEQGGIQASSRWCIYPRSSPAFPATSRDACSIISIHRQKICRPRGTAERKKKFALSVGITTDTDDTLEEQQQRDFRTWHDSTGIHWQHAALVHYKNGVVHLFLSDGTLLEIAEEKLGEDDLMCLRSQDVYKKAQRKVTFRPFCSPQSTNVIWNRMTDRV